MADLPSPSPLFEHEPRTEQEVVCLFGALLPYLNERLIVRKVGAAFPDCLAVRADNGALVRIEFELYGSNFVLHGHPYDGCEMLVCWRDDRRVWPNGFRVVELWHEVTSKCPWMIQRIGEGEPNQPWNEQSFFEQARMDGTPSSDVERMRAILGLVAARNWGPTWLAGGTATFAVGSCAQFFKVTSGGKIVFPFVRLPHKECFPELTCRLNESLGRELFVPQDVTSKKKIWQAADLFRSDSELTSFLGVWQWYAERTDAIG